MKAGSYHEAQVSIFLKALCRKEAEVGGTCLRAPEICRDSVASANIFRIIIKSQQGARGIQKTSRGISGNLGKGGMKPRLMETAFKSPYPLGGSH